eukprot:3877466-Pyramimonas_sp.AAC.1
MLIDVLLQPCQTNVDAHLDHPSHESSARRRQFGHCTFWGHACGRLLSSLSLLEPRCLQLTLLKIFLPHARQRHLCILPKI